MLARGGLKPLHLFDDRLGTLGNQFLSVHAILFRQRCDDVLTDRVDVVRVIQELLERPELIVYRLLLETRRPPFGFEFLDLPRRELIERRYVLVAELEEGFDTVPIALQGTA
nr:hypothetical protein [Natrinema altunense]